MIMSAMVRPGERFGAGHVIDIVRSANTKKIRDCRHNQLKTYGIGSNKDKKYWWFIIYELFAQGSLFQEGGRYPVLKISSKSWFQT